MHLGGTGLSEGVSSNPSRRVVALLPASASGPDVHPSVDVVRVSSGYEAAAELLAAPASALVVELGCLTQPHVALLEMAQRLDLPVIAFGTISADLTDAHQRQLRLVPSQGLADAVRRTLHIPAAAAPIVVVEDPPDEEPRVAPASLQSGTRAPTESLTQAELDALLGDNP